MEEEKDTPEIDIIAAEKVEAMYVNGTLIEPNYELHRLNTPNGRVYFLFEGDEPVFFGGSGMIGKELPTSDFLIQAISKNGYSAAKRNYYMRMLFGSFSHSRLAELFISGEVDLDGLPDALRQYYYDQNFHITEKEHYDMSREIQKDMISLGQWIIDYEVELAFVEFPVYSHVLNIASQIDLGAFVTVTEGSGKDKQSRRVFALIDYKSGKSGFYTEHIYQLYSNKVMFIERFPTFAENNVETWNLGGKNWRKPDSWGIKNKDGSLNRRSVPYSFVNQGDKVDYTDYNARLSAAQNHLAQRLEKPYTFFQGKMAARDNPKQFIVTKTLTELVKSGEWKRFIKTSASIPENAMAL